MRKVLSFVLVLALVLGSFSMAFGLTDVKGSDNSDAINVCNDLGIVEGFPDGTFKPDQAVNRAEFAAMITRALGVPESALAAYTSTSFKDVAGYGWAVKYLAFCESKGIMEGDGMGNVMPGRTISVNEAITMVARAIGYTNNSAVLVGSWPANYVTLGQDLGLYVDLATVATVDRANAAQVIYNALTVEKVQVNADGETNRVLVNGAPTNMLIGGLGATEVVNRILGKDYTYGDAEFNINNRLGGYGTAYTKDGDLVAFSATSTAITGKLNTSGKFVAGGVTYNWGTGLSGATTTDYIYNGIYDGGGARAVTYGLAAATGNPVEVTLNVGLSGKTITGVWSMTAWDPTDGGEVAAADIVDLSEGTLFGASFDLDDDDAIISSSYVLEGVDSLSEISVGDIVYVFEDATDDVIRKVMVTDETVTGKVTEVDGSKVTVNGKAYEFYSAANKFLGAVDDTAMPSAGSDVELVLDPYGYVYDFSSTTKADTFGVTIAGEINAAGSLDPSRVKMYTSLDEEKTYTIKSTTSLPWATGGTNVSAGAIVKYSLNSDGEINKVENTTYTSPGASSVTMANINLLYYGATPHKVASDVVVFVQDGTDYSVTDISNVEMNAELNTFKMFRYYEEDGEIVAMVIDDVNATKDADTLFAILSKVTTVVDADDDEIWRLQGVANGATLDKVTVDKTQSYATYTTLSGVTLSKLTLDGNGNVKVSAAGVTAKVGGASISAINSAKTVITISNTDLPLSDNVVVYEVVTKTSGTLIDYYKVSSVANLRAAANYEAYVYDLNTTDDGYIGFDVVVFVKH